MHWSWSPSKFNSEELLECGYIQCSQYWGLTVIILVTSIFCFSFSVWLLSDRCRNSPGYLARHLHSLQTSLGVRQTNQSLWLASGIYLTLVTLRLEDLTTSMRLSATSHSMLRLMCHTNLVTRASFSTPQQHAEARARSCTGSVIWRSLLSSPVQHFYFCVSCNTQYSSESQNDRSENPVGITQIY